ncbi:polysaccharide biosynthesis protein [Oceanirhabdus sp. W0125-5]|uniref:polysaccharide biosynthesis protein n=1 Tax=Oceanirhabdus sp. W0125-5 TaxID=2999116 RepID=UPI0022F2DEA1|nr:nucleoside-diphosphate sugar epimerase/dehydratase [Oceanirhabdus sp. W0125-5]WBW98943.1 nucleoside-diphosphate sugar epimerase/dehydratase [Oceanirhabdus sp. W0125-5]
MRYLKKNRNIVLALADCLIVYVSYVLANYVRYDYKHSLNMIDTMKSYIPILIGIYIVVFTIFRLYKSLWEHASIEEFMYAVGACASCVFIVEIINFLWKLKISFSVLMIANMFIFFMVFSLRISFRLYRRIVILTNKTCEKKLRTMVIGAGEVGVALIKDMKTNKNSLFKPVCIIDDDYLKQGRHIHGLKVYGGREKIKELVDKKQVELILIAIPSIPKKEKADLIDICTLTGCKVKIVPGLIEIINGDVTLNNIRDIKFEDMLGRDEVALENEGIEDYITGKKVLVTGGGGSIGSELCRQISKFKPKELIILDIYENNAYDIQNELTGVYKDLKLDVIIASVRDKKRIYEIFREKKPDVVFHAAAHKHVPLMERNPVEAIKNNVFGTYNVVNAADEYGTKRFVLISTDKAVNPTNIMGATKRICELIIQGKNKVSKTQYVAVRFGNVLGSNGSVIPLFVKQIQNGGPVTVTHKEITRFFMTISEAAQLVLQAGAYAKGGEIFVLDMGEPVKIYEFAEKLIKLFGYTPNEDVNIKITGLRPGEKLYEELLLNEEGLGATPNNKIFIGKPSEIDITNIEKNLCKLYRAVDMNNISWIVGIVEEIVPTYSRKTNTEVAATI